ncbi:MAG: hypothetical protein V1895_00700 [Parcubacteria group bacterium]
MHSHSSLARRLFFVATAVVLFCGVTLPVVAAEQAAGQKKLDLCISSDFYKTVTQYYNIAIGVAILSAIFVIVVGSYRMVVAAGNTGMIAAGKKMIYNAILGLSIAVLSGVILNTLGGAAIRQGKGCKPTSIQQPIVIMERLA